MKLSISITSILIGSASIAIVSAQDIAFGTNKTLAPTPGVIRPNAPPVPPPITPFPTEPNVVSIYFNFMICIGCCRLGVWVNSHVDVSTSTLLLIAIPLMRLSIIVYLRHLISPLYVSIHPLS